MAEYSRIEWTDHTFNPWWGCVRVSPGCEHCYAEAWAKRVGEKVWGVSSPRRFFGPKHWKDVLKWDREAKRDGVIRSVFCGSMCDFAEINESVAIDETREWLWELTQHTKNLRWLMLTKRPENVLAVCPPAWRDGFPDNIWIGSTFEDQKRLDERFEYLRKIPAHLFASCEPLLESVKFFAVYHLTVLRWVIVGGESGPGARPYNLECGQRIVDACRRYCVPVFHKQIGSRPERMPGPVAWPAEEPHGRDMNEWPAELRVRQFPWVPAPLPAKPKRKHRALPMLCNEPVLA